MRTLRPLARATGAGGGQRTATRDRRRSPLVTTLLILVVVGIAASLIAQFWTEVLWFDSVNFRRVFVTELGAKVLLGVVGGLVTAAIVGSSLYIAYRTRPIYAPTSTNQDALERYRAAVEPLRRIAMIGIPLHHRPAVRPRRGGAVGDVPAVAQRPAVRQDRPAVRDGRRLLRLHAAVADLRGRASSAWR